MTIVITPAEERAAAEFRRQCEIVWWQVKAVARDDLMPLSALLSPSTRAPVTLARQDAALAASDAGASRAAIGTILSVGPAELRLMLEAARTRRARGTVRLARRELRTITGGRG